MFKTFLTIGILIILAGCADERPIIIQAAPIICDPEKRELTDLLSQNALSTQEDARLRHLSLKLGHSFLRKKPKDPFYAGYSRPDEFELVPNLNFKMGPICK